MKVIRDCFGRSVRLTDERLTHILEHAELAGMADELARVLQSPTHDSVWFSGCDKRFERSEAVERLERLERASV